MKKIITGTIATVGLVVMTPLAAFAHVVVTPAQAAIGSETEFNVSVPNEREAAVTSLKLDVPAGLDEVEPDVISGWTITTDKSGDDVTAITWTGNIPVGQREDFGFKAQLPAKASELDWKAYQTYADGTVVSWDQKPAPNAPDDDAVTTGPYSITKVVNDLTPNTTTANTGGSGQTTLALLLSFIAVIFSALGLVWRRRK